MDDISKPLRIFSRKANTVFPGVPVIRSRITNTTHQNSTMYFPLNFKRLHRLVIIQLNTLKVAISEKKKNQNQLDPAKQMKKNSPANRSH